MVVGRTPSTAVPGDARQRLSRRDWIEEALEVIATQGLPAVAVEPIAARLGVTKGSFYAHFGAHAELVAAALERWRQVDTDDVLASLATIDDPRQRVVGFLDLGFGRRYWGRIFAALCASAADPQVDPVMREVRADRLAYLESALGELGLNGAAAHERATLIYAAYVGFWRLVAADEGWEYNENDARMRLAQHLAAALIPDAKAG